ncbi:hypothetical protein PMAYCL1PPCAC_00258, partial [Pristionchus mayeri]
VSCETWKMNGFCENPGYTDAMKKQYCCKACSATAPPANPTTDCAVINEGASTEVVNSAPTTAMEAVVNKELLSKVFVKNGCSLKLWVDPFTQAADSPIAGTDAFTNLAGDATTAIGYECTCP